MSSTIYTVVIPHSWTTSSSLDTEVGRSCSWSAALVPSFFGLGAKAKEGRNQGGRSAVVISTTAAPSRNVSDDEEMSEEIKGGVGWGGGTREESVVERSISVKELSMTFQRPHVESMQRSQRTRTALH